MIEAGKIISSENTTVAGGFATGIAYEIPFEIYKDSLNDFVVLSKNEIYEGIALAGYYTRNFLEGAGASSIMAAIKLKTLLIGKRWHFNLVDAMLHLMKSTKLIVLVSSQKAGTLFLHYCPK